MAKRISVFLGMLTLAVFSAPLAAGSYYVQGKVSYFLPTEQAFKDIYSQRMMYGGEVGLNFKGSWGFWLSLDYYKGTGKLTVTEEATTLTLMPAGLGIRYSFRGGSGFNPYVAAGAGYFTYKESNVIGEVKKSSLGAIGKAGIVIAVSKPVFIDFQASYSYCQVQPAEVKANLGGLLAGVALRIEF